MQAPRMRHAFATLAILAVSATGALAQAESNRGAGGAGSSKSMGQKLSQSACEAKWNEANPSNAASISESHASQFITDVKSVNPDGDGTIERGEFMNACDRGLIKSSSTTGAGSGEQGSGSSRMPKNR